MCQSSGGWYVSGSGERRRMEQWVGLLSKITHSLAVAGHMAGIEALNWSNEVSINRWEATMPDWHSLLHSNLYTHADRNVKSGFWVSVRLVTALFALQASALNMMSLGQKPLELLIWKKKKKCDSLTLRYSHRQTERLRSSRNLISLSEWDICDRVLLWPI